MRNQCACQSRYHIDIAQHVHPLHATPKWPHYATYVVFQRTIIFQIAFCPSISNWAAGFFQAPHRGGMRTDGASQSPCLCSCALVAICSWFAYWRLRFQWNFMEFFPVYRTRWSQLNWSPPECPWNPVKPGAQQACHTARSRHCWRCMGQQQAAGGHETGRHSTCLVSAFNGVPNWSMRNMVRWGKLT